jgi:hypothetical protein
MRWKYTFQQSIPMQCSMNTHVGALKIWENIRDDGIGKVVMYQNAELIILEMKPTEHGF